MNTRRKKEKNRFTKLSFSGIEGSYMRTTQFIIQLILLHLFISLCDKVSHV
jgi:hypothetical protein